MAADNSRICLYVLLSIAFVESDNRVWNSKDYPDIRSKEPGVCGDHVPPFGYVCDPTGTMISKTDAEELQKLLYYVARNSPCKCQRRSQCMTETATDDQPVKVGFVVAVAFAKKLTVPSGKIEKSVETFSRGLRNRWGLGDCGNSALILIWEEQEMVHISMDEEKTKLYLTEDEARQIEAKVKDKIKNKEYFAALEEILIDMKVEFDGQEEKPIDVGTVALAVSAAVAIAVVIVITGCVCAFRCCGNLRNGNLKETLERVDSLKAEVMRRNAPNYNDPKASGSFYDGGHSIV